MTHLKMKWYMPAFLAGLAVVPVSGHAEDLAEAASVASKPFDGNKADSGSFVSQAPRDTLAFLKGAAASGNESTLTASLNQPGGSKVEVPGPIKVENVALWNSNPLLAIWTVAGAVAGVYGGYGLLTYGLSLSPWIAVGLIALVIREIYRSS